jgi:hypothetical protein
MKCRASLLLKDKDLYAGITGNTGTVGVIWHQIDTKNTEAIAELNRGGTARLRFYASSLSSLRQGFADPCLSDLSLYY